MNRMFYQNEIDTSGFLYQNPIYLEDHRFSHDFNRNPVPKKDLPLATIYVRPQVYKGINSPSDALKQGTAFAELYRPFPKRGPF